MIKNQKKNDIDILSNVKDTIYFTNYSEISVSLFENANKRKINFNVVINDFKLKGVANLIL